MLLSRAPDIQAAEARLIAANADVSAAHAAFFPTVNLSASAARSDLLSSGSTTMMSLVSSLVGTIFSGGNRSKQLKLSEAARQELVESYGQTVLTSLHEVQNSLAAVDNQQVRAELLTEPVQQAQEMYRLANVRYLSGAENLSTVIDAQSSLLDAQDSLVQAQLARYIAAVTLFKALGGGWMSTLSPDG